MMKTLNIVLLGTLLASTFAVNAAADSRHGDRFQFRIYDEHVSKHQKRINHKKQNRQNGQKTYAKQHDKSYSNGYSNGYGNKHSNRHSNKQSNKHSKGYAKSRSGYDDQRYDGHQGNGHNKAHNHGRWETVGSFRGRSGKHVTRHINVDDRVQELSLQGTKRGMVVRRAHALLGNGRWVRAQGWKAI